jgi:hypothetical protein
VAWVLLWRSDTAAHHVVVALLELPAVLVALHVGWYAFPDRARAMRRHAEAASIAYARFVRDTIRDEIRRSVAGGDAIPRTSAAAGAGSAWDSRCFAAARQWGQVVGRILSKVLQHACVSSFNAAKESDFLLNAWMYGTVGAALIPGAVTTLDEWTRDLHPDDRSLVLGIASILLAVAAIVCRAYREQVHSTCCSVRSALFAAACFVYDKLVEGAGEAYEEWKAQGKTH